MGPNTAGMSPLQIVVSFRFSTNMTAPAIVQLIQHSTPIDVLDNDCLLNTFHLYWPLLLDGVEDHSDCILWGLEWNCKHWWYKLTHVCQRW